MLVVQLPQPISVYENQIFISRHVISDSLSTLTPVYLSSYTVRCPASSNVTVAITSNILTIAGVYKGVFEDDWLEFRTSGLTTITARVESFDELPKYYYKAFRYNPDQRTQTSIAISIYTNLGEIHLTQIVYNDWTAKRNRLMRFIHGGELNPRDVFPDTALPGPTYAFGDFISSDNYFSYNQNIVADTNNLVLDQSALTAAGWDGTTPVRININVNSGVVVGSNSTGLYSLDTGTTAWPVGSIFSLTNNGYIVGAGGDGASGTGYGDLKPGSPGGPAIRVNLLTQIINYNIIGGGGGGSGRAGYGGSNGGRGAGGAGRIVGLAVGSGNATNGTLTYGGTTQYGHVNGAGNQPDTNQYTTYGSTLGQDGDTGGYGGAGGTGGNAITGFSYVTYLIQGRVHGRTTG